MKLSYKKGKLGKSLGQKSSSKKTFGNKPQNISLSESQFTRLMENFVLEQESAAFYDEIDAELAEEFGDGDYTGSANFDTENFNNPVDLDEKKEWEDVTGDGKFTQADVLKLRGVELDELDSRRSYEKGMFNAGDGADDESFDGHHYKHSVIGAYDDDLTGKSRRGEVYEDSEGMETYHYDEDLHHDRDELHHLERERNHSHGGHAENLRHHIAALIDSMKYDDKRGVGHDDKYRREPGTHFYHEGNGFVNESKKMSKRQQARLLSEAKRELRRRTLREEQMSPPLINPIEEADRLADVFNNNKIKIKYNNDNKVFNIKRAYRDNGAEVVVFTDDSQPWLFDGDNPDITISGDEYGEFKPVAIDAYDNSDGKQVALDVEYQREGLTNKNQFSNLNDGGYTTGTGIPIDIRFGGSEMDKDYKGAYYYSVGGPG